MQSVYAVPDASRSSYEPRRATFDPQNEYAALIRQKAQEKGLSAAQGELLTRIAWCESGLKQDRWNYMNPTGDPNSKWSAYGLFQVISSHERTFGVSRMTAEGNIEIAIGLYEAHGTQPWVASRGCWSTLQ